jgi:hypothetical protein
MIMPRASRISKLALAFWYVLAFTNLPAFALDQLIPQTKTIASANFPCAHHSCGCKTAEQCRLHCCCFPKRQPHGMCRLHEQRHGPAEHAAGRQPATVKVSLLSVAQCTGHSPASGALGGQKLEPHLPMASVMIAAAESPRRLAWDVSTVSSAVFRDPPDKVPL